MKNRVILLLLLIILLTTCLTALNLSEAKEKALQQNLGVRASKQSYTASKWAMVNSYLDLLPSGSASANYTNYLLPYSSSFGSSIFSSTDDNSSTFEAVADDNLSYSLTLSQPLFNGGKIWLGARMQTDAFKMASQNYRATKLATIAEVESKYFSILEQEEILEIARKDKAIAHKNLEVANIRYDAGTLSKADYLKIQSDAASKEVILINAQNLYTTTRADFANFLQINNTFTLEKVTLEDALPFIAKLSAMKPFEEETLMSWCIETGIDNNPTLQIAALSRAMDKKTSLMALGNFLPSLNFSYQHNWNENMYADDEFMENETYAIVASVPLCPLFDNFSSWREARSTYKESDYEYQDIEDNITLAIKRTIFNLIAQAKSVQASRIAFEYAQESYEQMETRFKNGLISTTELLSSEIMYISSEMNYTKSYYSFLKTKTQLMQVTGLEDERKVWSNTVFK